MKIIYGKGECVLENKTEIIKSIVIKYRGGVRLSHNHLRLDAFLGNDKVLIGNRGSKSLLIQGNNQIHIGYTEGFEVNNELFKYNGDFKILSAKVNDRSVTAEAFGVDYCELINSKFDNMGKPEQYRGTYRYGRGGESKKQRKRTTKRLSTKTTTRRSGGGGY